jgi:Tol biopolymer transport system component
MKSFFRAYRSGLLLVCLLNIAACSEIQSAASQVSTSEKIPVLNPSELPHSLYYIGTDSSGNDQIWRVDAKISARAQITYEPFGIQDFDISPTDEALAYVSNNQLILASTDGSNRKVLIESNPDDEREFIHSINWKPDGKALAYGLGGVNLIQIENNQINKILPNPKQIESGQDIFTADYASASWSPDGSLLLVEVDDFKQISYAVYNFATGSLIPLKQSEDSFACCTTSWEPDGRAILAAAAYNPIHPSGLWRYPVDGGQAINLIPDRETDGTFNLVDFPLMTPDKKLYYFYTNLPQKPDGTTPLKIVSSEADGKSNRTLLRPDSPYYTHEALWAKDGSLVVIVQIPAGAPTESERGPVVVLFSDGRSNMTLAPDGFHLRWGL